MNHIIWSNVVKLMPTATGPLIQFMLSPLYRPFLIPSCVATLFITCRIVAFVGAVPVCILKVKSDSAFSHIWFIFLSRIRLNLSLNAVFWYYTFFVRYPADMKPIVPLVLLQHHIIAVLRRLFVGLEICLKIEKFGVMTKKLFGLNLIVQELLY